MDAKDVYGRQETLRDLEQRHENLGCELAEADARAARSGAPVGTQDYLTSPAYRESAAAVEALRAEVLGLQHEVGGVVYRVPAENLEGVKAKVAKLTKVADRVGATLNFTVALTETEVSEDGHEAWVTHYCTLCASQIKLADWALLARLSIEEAGVMVAKVPAYARAWTLHREGRGDAPSSFGYGEAARTDEALLAAKTHLDATDLAGYASLETASNCDYCGKPRRRTATYVVEHLGTGERRQVGSNCLRDFLGIDPHQTLRWAEWLRDLDEELERRGPRVKPEVPTLDYLIHVCTMIRTNGWEPRSGTHPTADEAETNRYYFAKQSKDSKGQPNWVEPTADDEARAKAALAWADEHLGAKRFEVRDASCQAHEGLSEFEQNLWVAAKNTIVTRRTQGTLAYLPVAHAKYEAREIERRERAKVDSGSEWVGSEKERLELTLTVIEVFERGDDYGVTFITKLRDADGNVFKWFGSYGLDQGATMVGKWTIKGHSEYKGTKETRITRPAGLRDASEPAPAPRKTLRKVGERAPVVVNGEQVGEVEKCVGGFEAVVNGQRSDRAETRNRAEDTAYQMHLDQKHAAERDAYLTMGLPDGLEVARGCPRHQEHLDFAKHLRPGDSVAVIEAKARFPYESEWGLAVPPGDNTDGLTFVEVEVYTRERDGQMRMRVTLPDGHVCSLGEQEMIRRPYKRAEEAA